MILLDCPACGYGFVHRRAKRCPRCTTVLLKTGEWHVADVDERAFMLTDTGWQSL